MPIATLHHLRSLRRHIVLMASLAALATLPACGGGDDDPGTATTVTPSSAGTVDAYVGTWLSDCFTSIDGSSFQLQTVTSKLDSNRMQNQYSSFRYASGNCSGTGTREGAITSDTATIQGTKSTLSGQLVGKFVVDNGSRTFKDIAFIDGRARYQGDLGGSMDADGYANELKSSFVLHKS